MASDISRLKAHVGTRTFLADLGDEAVDINLLGLSDSVGSVHRLQVGLGVPREVRQQQSSAQADASRFERDVPVAVKEDDDVGGDEIDAETSRAGREEEGELLRVGRIVLVDGRNSVLVGGPSVDAAVLCAQDKGSVCERAKT